MSYPQTEMTVQTVKGPLTLHIGLNPWVFTMLLIVLGFAWGIGKASVFKYISDQYPENIGVISGIVGLIGGLGGFLLPILFGVLGRPYRLALEHLHVAVGHHARVARLDVLDRDRPSSA